MADHPTQSHGDHSGSESAGQGHYGRLAAMTGLSFVAMYLLMYAMVSSFDNVFMNLNQAYMAGLMAAPMALIELLVMRGMYRNRRLNLVIGSAALAGTAICFLLIRQQAAIGNDQFLRSMIPHHAGAILMCEEAPISAAAIQSLCESIIESQQREIDQMKALLGRGP